MKLPVWVLSVLAAAVSGGLMAACFWPLNLHLLAWLALVPWLLVVARLTPWQAWLSGSVLGLVFFRAGLNWLFGINGLVAGAVIVAFSAWMGLSFWLAKRLMQRFGLSAMLWAVPLAFVGQEVLRSEGLPTLRFAYLAFGYSQAHNLWIAQIASMGGVYALTLLLIAFNAALAYGICRRRARSFVPVAAVGVAILLLAFVSQPGPRSALKEISVACVQDEVYDYKRYYELTRQAAGGADSPQFIVLPEHTITEFADRNHAFTASLMELAHQHGVFICVGAHTRPVLGAKCAFDNVALLIGPDGELVGHQAKAVPLPFFDDGNPARTQTTFATPHGRIGLYVCYDGDFTDVSRRLVSHGAELMLVPVTNPKQWPSQQRWQQADMAVFRSIELRRCAVRAASSGISQIIDATGHVRAQRAQEQGPGILYGKVYAVRGATVFARGGYLLATFLATAFLAGLIIMIVIDTYGFIARRLATEEHIDVSS